MLGLDHVKRCAIMSGFPSVYCGRPKKRWQHWCPGPKPDDVRGAIKLYGGRVAVAPTYCDIAPVPTPPTAMTVGPVGSSSPVVRLKAPRGTHIAAVEVARFRGDCPATDAAARGRRDRVVIAPREVGKQVFAPTDDPYGVLWRRTVAPGKAMGFTDTKLPEAIAIYCYRAVSIDAWQRRSRGATAVLRSVPDG